MPTNIEWCMETWNPITGCTPISEGCEHCYALRMAKRLAGRFGYPKDDPFRPGTFHADKLDLPLRWKKPRRIFVSSMGDLFHERVPVFKIDEVMDVVRERRLHRFLFLTKRPKRMKEYFDYFYRGGAIKPFKNIWLGVTAENQERLDERVPILLEIPAAVRFVSIEPMLSFVNLTDYFYKMPHIDKHRLDWVIVGGETGPGARPMDPQWARDARDQCRDAGVPFFFKQWGEWTSGENVDDLKPHTTKQYWDGKWDDCSDDWATEKDYGPIMYRVGKKRAGRLLDGQEHNEYPEAK